MNRFFLPSSEYVTCVLWNNRYHITGTDIVRALVFRFEAFGRPVKNMKKFEEGIFSDLRNLKPGVDASLEEPKSPFLDLLFKYQCIRTQKKQKVFYWFSVPHDRLFLDALERDLKREKMGFTPTTVIAGEPAQSFTYEPHRSLYEQFSKAQNVMEAPIAIRHIDASQMHAKRAMHGSSSSISRPPSHDLLNPHNSCVDAGAVGPSTMPYMGVSIFEGSPTYKQRRKKSANRTSFVARSEPEDNHHTHSHPSDISVGYGLGDSAMTAADMFISQARSDPDVAIRRRSNSMPQGQDNWAAAFAPAQNLVNFPVGPHPHSSVEDLSQPHLRSLTQDCSSPPFCSDIEHRPASSGKAPTTKAFACPLFSCGRFFKRMEHLKRHVRTHTMERPFQCERCGRRFSRSDNLNQHLRIHARAEGVDSASAEFEGDINDDTEEGDVAFAAALSFAEGGLHDMEMCEVELQGHVQDVQGDEEGLLTVPTVNTTSNRGFDGSYFLQNVGGHQTIYAEPSEMNWATPFVNSPAMTATSNRSSYMGPLSGPPHVQEFGVDNLRSSEGLGPHRRHSCPNSSSTRSHSVSSNSSRSYHPYASASHSRASSNRSSPSPLSQPREISSVPFHAMSHDAFRVTQPRSFSTHSNGHEFHGTLDIGDVNYDNMFSMSLYSASGSLDLSHPYPEPNFESNVYLNV